MFERTVVVALALCVALAACRSEAGSPAAKAVEPGSAPAAGQVSAAHVADGIVITNGSGSTIAYVVSNRAWLGLLAPCTDRTVNCARLAAGQKATVRFADIAGGASGYFVEGVVYYWPVVGGLVRGEATEIIVRM